MLTLLPDLKEFIGLLNSNNENIISALNPIVTPIEVRFRDTDAMGHINNAVYHTYLEHCRIRFMDALNLSNLNGDRRPPIILARTEIDYLKPGFMGDNIVISGWLTAVGSKSFTMKFHIKAGERLLARAVSVQVWYDYAADRSMVIPEDARRLFAQLLQAGESK